MANTLRVAVRDLVDRSPALGMHLRRLRRHLQRRRLGGNRLGNVAMLHAGRCGSSVVADLLDQHPDVWWAGELFENMAPIYYRMDSAHRAEERIANAMHRVSTPWYGFDSKYLPEQHLRPELANQSIEGYVALLKRLGFDHFMLVGRRNHLRRAVSVTIGTKTGQWNTAGEVRRVTVRLDPGRFMSYGTEMSLIDYFRSLDEIHERARRAIRSEHHLELEYESDIEKDPRVAYGRTAAWLGLRDFPVEVRLKKINTRPMRELVENFDEVAAVLRGTPHAWMLED